MSKIKPTLRRAKQVIRKRPAVAIVIGVGVIGVMLLAITRAAGFSISLEPETGTRSNVQVISDTTASNGQAVQFGTATTAGFKHPGILVSKEQLDFVKAKVAAGEQPWKAAFDQTRANYLANKTWTPKPVTEIKCSTGNFENVYPQVGCIDQRRDAEAAYTQALLWYYTGDQAYAQNVIKIINAWSSTHTKTWFDQPRLVNGQVVYGNPGDNNNCNCPQVYASGLLQTAWVAQNITRAAEIIRYTNAGWAQADVAKAENYFKTVYIDALGAGWTRTTNWETSVAESWTNIGIFTNDKAIYDKGIAYWRQEVPRYIYLTSDGAKPLSPYKSLTWVTGTNGIKYPVTSIIQVSDAQLRTGWYDANSYISGLGAETCRDIGHLFMGFGGISNVAETARIQGTDLWGEQKDRIIAGYELNAGYMNQFIDAGKPAMSTGWNPTNWPCAPVFEEGGNSAYLGLEVALNHYNLRQGNSMPQTKRLAERVRPSKQGLLLGWETLTHYGTQ